MLNEETIINATKKGDNTKIAECLKAGVSINTVQTFSKKTLLMLAADYRRADTVLFLLQAGGITQTNRISIDELDITRTTLEPEQTFRPDELVVNVTKKT